MSWVARSRATREPSSKAAASWAALARPRPCSRASCAISSPPRAASPPVSGEQALPDLDCAFTLHPDAEENGEELGVTQRRGPVLGHLLTGTLLGGKVVDDHSPGLEEACSNEQYYFGSQNARILEGAKTKHLSFGQLRGGGPREVVIADIAETCRSHP